MSLISCTIEGEFESTIQEYKTCDEILQTKSGVNSISFKTINGRITIFDKINFKITNVKNVSKIIKICFKITQQSFKFKITNYQMRLKILKPKIQNLVSLVNLNEPFKLCSNLFSTNSCSTFVYKTKLMKNTTFKTLNETTMVVDSVVRILFSKKNIFFKN